MSDVFAFCRIIEGHVALFIPSTDHCTQWVAVNTIWNVVPSPMYYGPYWVGRYPRKVAPGWSLLAVAPCLD